MTFSLTLLLIPYAIFLSVWLFLSLVGFYHLMRYSGQRMVNFSMGLVYCIGSVILLLLSFALLSPIDWNQQITIFQSSIETSSFMDLDY